MKENISLELDNLVKEIRNSSNIKVVYLFGSYAYGKPHAESDLDICIIAEDKSLRKIDIIKNVRKAISKVATMPIDLIVYYSDEFKERSNIKFTMEHQISNHGVKLYEQIKNL
ncbi:MAG: nucleotidyltransferase domain-containing protein [Clostridium sp.]|uniref:nucleotidyltransferase domain-containing protein n=1 Tax=Clostridium sp. TaxID=1506 RepID=UPI003F3AC84E